MHDADVLSSLIEQATATAERASETLEAGANAEVDLKVLDQLMQDYNRLLFGATTSLSSSVLPPIL